MNHLEELTRQYYDWKGYLVKGNIKVGRLSHGGWAGELDIVAFHPQTEHLVHVEPSIDALSWEKRKVKFKKKFDIGKRYIYKDVFPWLSSETQIDKIAILTRSTNEPLGDFTVISIDEFVKKVKDEIREQGIMGKSAIPEEFDLLRTIQMTINGYYKIL